MTTFISFLSVIMTLSAVITFVFIFLVILPTWFLELGYNYLHSKGMQKFKIWWKLCYIILGCLLSAVFWWLIASGTILSAEQWCNRYLTMLFGS